MSRSVLARNTRRALRLPRLVVRTDSWYGKQAYAVATLLPHVSMFVFYAPAGTQTKPAKDGLTDAGQRAEGLWHTGLSDEKEVQAPPLVP